MRATSRFCPSPEFLRRLAPVVAGLFLFPSLISVAPAAPPRRGALLPLDASVATRFRADGAQVAVVHVSVPYRHLVFKRVDGAFASRLEVSVVAEAGGERVGGGFAAVDVTVEDYAGTRIDDPVSCAVDVPVPADRIVDLRLKAAVAGTSRRWEDDLRYDPRTAGAVPYHFTGFSWNLDGAAPSERVLDGEADSLTVVLTLASHPVTAGAASADLLIFVRNAQGQDLNLGSRRLGPASGDSLVHRDAFSAGRLPFGALEFGARVRADDGVAFDLTPARSFVNLCVPFADGEAWARHVDWLKGLADDTTRRTLLNTSPAGRREEWRAFWDARPTEAVPDERGHLMRIVEADERFGRFGRGALSDRGHVYVEQGPPDRVETTEPDPSYPGVWEIWYYREVGLAYRFYDSYGLGDYRLYDTVPY